PDPHPRVGGQMRHVAAALANAGPRRLTAGWLDRRDHELPRGLGRIRRARPGPVLAAAGGNLAQVVGLYRVLRPPVKERRCGARVAGLVRRDWPRHDWPRHDWPGPGVWRWLRGRPARRTVRRRAVRLRSARCCPAVIA